MYKRDGLWYVAQMKIENGMVKSFKESHGDVKAIALEDLKIKSVNTFWRDSE